MTRAATKHVSATDLSALSSAVKRLSLDQKFQLEKILGRAIAADIAALGCPPGAMSANNPNLGAELDRRWREAQDHPEKCLTLDQLMRNLARRRRARQAPSQTPSRRGNRKS